jgi:glutamine amidotransferase
MGNLASIQNMIKKIGEKAEISSNPKDILNASKLILPGVGAFERGIKNIKDLNLIDSLNEAVLVKKIPILGICLGMQLMTNFSEEGNVEGLKWIDARTIKFRLDNQFKIPHIGWTNVKTEKNSKLINGIEENRFYFVHSYHVICSSKNDILLTAEYGYSFVAGFEKDNIIGVQFHPEKSHKFGMQLFRNFLMNY